MDIYTATEQAFHHGFDEGRRSSGWKTARFDPVPGKYYAVIKRVGTDTDNHPVISEPFVFVARTTSPYIRDICLWLELPDVPTIE